MFQTDFAQQEEVILLGQSVFTGLDWNVKSQSLRDPPPQTPYHVYPLVDQTLELA